MLPTDSLPNNQGPPFAPGGAVSPIVDPVLAKYAAEIRRLGKRVKEDVIEIGRYLDRAQKHAGRGAWLAWIEREFGWSDQTAYRFIHLYQAEQNSEEFHKLWNSDLPLSGLYQLAAPNTPDEARQEIAQQIGAGEKLSVAKIKEVVSRAKADGDEQSKPRKRKSRFDAEHYAFILGEHIGRLAELPEEHPDRFEQVLDHLLNDADFVNALAALARHPKIGAVLAAVAAKVGDESLHAQPDADPAHFDLHGEAEDLRGEIGTLKARIAELQQAKPAKSKSGTLRSSTSALALFCGPPPDRCTPLVLFDPQHYGALDRLAHRNEGARQKERFPRSQFLMRGRA